MIWCCESVICGFRTPLSQHSTSLPEAWYRCSDKSSTAFTTIGTNSRTVRLHGTELCRQAPEDMLSAMRDNPFIRCHQSFWVNRAKIFSLVGSSFHLIDGSEVLISRSYRKEAIRLFEESVLTPPASRRSTPV